MTLNGEEEERQPSEIITEVSRAESKSERKNSKRARVAAAEVQ